ncbi:MAG: FAD-binding protein [Calothrix sp. MO_192.B10]|nr:FAD-binding protein [Calothrix sp. MO_192.B10]
MNSIIADLQPLIEGEISCDHDDLLHVSQDFGGIVQKQPKVIVRPQNATDIAKAIQYAANQNITISSRASGHSLSGQSLNQDGILLDMRSLNRVHKLHTEQLWFKADAGVTWRQIVDATTPHRMIPPVLTNYFDVTLGGTHSAAGLGQSSFRYGSQADNCLGLEVVTATGEIVWCSPNENSELFNHVLCGYGQFGIITQIQHRLKPYRPFTRTYFLCYDNLDSFLHDERLLIAEDRVDGLLALFSPCIMGVTRGGGKGLKPLIEWFYRMQITLEVDSENDIDQEKLFSGLNFYRHVYTENLTFEQFVQPAIAVPHLTGTVNPWIDVLLPGSAAKEFIETVLGLVPGFIDFRMTPIGSFGLVAGNTNMPMFSLPDDELIVGFGMYPTVPKTQIQPVLEQLKLITDLAFKMGGKRYLASWAELDLAQWRLQFGDYWPKINQLKQKYDPQGILNPGFIQYEYMTATQINQQMISQPQLPLEPVVATSDS